jgi:hypothetical protein
MRTLKEQPFCGGSHTAAHSDGTETSSRAPFAHQAESSGGPTLTLSDNESLCAFPRFCDSEGKIL